MVTNASANNLTAFTRAIKDDILVDNIFTSNPLLFRLRQSGSVKKAGGTSVQHQVVASTGVGGPYSGGFDGLVTDDQEFALTAQMEWRFYHEPITVAETELLLNNGEKIIDLMSAKMQFAGVALADVIGDGIHSDGSGSGGDEIDGLQNILSTTTTVDNISVATFSNWIASIDAVTNTLTLNAIDVQMMNQTIGAQRPTDIVMNRRTFAKAQQLVRGAMTTNADAFTTRSMTEMADAGFPVIGHQGVPMYFDDKAPGSGAGTTDNFVEFLNLNRIQLVMHEQDDFTVSDFVPATNQRAKIAFVFATLNVRTLERRTQGAFTAIDPAL